jgi:hypothetical protein
MGGPYWRWERTPDNGLNMCGGSCAGTAQSMRGKDGAKCPTTDGGRRRTAVSRSVQAIDGDCREVSVHICAAAHDKRVSRR